MDDHLTVYLISVTSYLSIIISHLPYFFPQVNTLEIFKQYSFILRWVTFLMIACLTVLLISNENSDERGKMDCQCLYAILHNGVFKIADYTPYFK